MTSVFREVEGAGNLIQPHFKLLLYLITVRHLIGYRVHKVIPPKVQGEVAIVIITQETMAERGQLATELVNG